MYQPDKDGVSMTMSLDEACTRCGACVKECAFLQEYGMPGDIAEAGASGRVNPFECSLCGLCDAVCPEGLRCSELFLTLRRQRTEAGAVDYRPYRPILDFERRGASDALSLIRVPKGGDTVFFPGCGLPATRARTVRRLFEALQGIQPDIGVALGCCMKPSHDLGRVSHFENRFGRLRERLADAGVTRVVTTCPNCQAIFTRHGEGMEVVTAYVMLASSGFTPEKMDVGDAVVHDPCPQRHDRAVQDAVRALAERADITVVPSKRERKLTRCCGEGGSVPFVRREFAERWTKLCAQNAGDKRIITSCAGCAGFLGRASDAVHILDVLFDSRPKIRLAGPFADMARKRLRRWFEKRLG